MSDDWKASVNSQLTQLHGDVRNLLYGLLGAVVLLAGAGWAAYSKLSDQSSDLKVQQAKIGGKIDTIDVKLQSQDEKLDRLLQSKVAGR